MAQDTDALSRFLQAAIVKARKPWRNPGLTSFCRPTRGRGRGPGEVAAALGRAEFTVREWCRLGRVRAEKKKSGRGPAGEWIVSHAELTRVRNEGLLPDAGACRGAK